MIDNQCFCGQSQTRELIPLRESIDDDSNRVGIRSTIKLGFLWPNLFDNECVDAATAINRNPGGRKIRVNGQRIVA